MLPMTPPVSKSDNPTLLDAALGFAVGESLEHCAALAEMSGGEFLAWLDSNENEVDRHLAQQKASGKLSEARAVALLEKVLANLECQLAEMSPAMALRLGEFALRVSGLAERRAAEASNKAAPTGFGIQIIFPPSAAPEKKPAITGEAREVLADD